MTAERNTPATEPSHDPIFDAAVSVVLEHEGGYVNRPDDRGGETNWGISRRTYPDLDIENLTRRQAADIYRRDWWLKYGYGRLPLLIAAKVLDFAVMAGPGDAGLMLQRALRACGRPVVEDGTIGSRTIAAALGADDRALIAAMRSEMAAHCRCEVLRDPGQQGNLAGWLKRAYD